MAWRSIFNFFSKCAAALAAAARRWVALVCKKEGHVKTCLKKGHSHELPEWADAISRRMAALYLSYRQTAYRPYSLSGGYVEDITCVLFFICVRLDKKLCLSFLFYVFLDNTINAGNEIRFINA